MRITEGMMIASYSRNLRTSLSNLSASNMKLTSKKQLNHVPEDPARAAKAFSVQTQIARDEQYSSVMENTNNELKTISNSVMNLTFILETVIEKSSEIRETIDQTAMNSIAEELKGLKEEVSTLMNVQYGNKYLFDSTNVSGASFMIDDSGALLYDKKAVDKYDPDNPDTRFPSNRDMYLDVGCRSTGLNGDNRGIKVSMSGVEMLGYGTDDRGRVNNLYSTIDDIENKLGAGDQIGTIEPPTNLKDKQGYITITTAEIGTRQDMLGRTKSRLSSELLTLQESQDNLEDVDMKKEAVNYQGLRTTWQATLQTGSALTLPSIFDFMNQQQGGTSMNVSVSKITSTSIRLSIASRRVRLKVKAPESDALAAPGTQQQPNMKTQSIKVGIDLPRAQNSMEYQSISRTAIQYAKVPAQTLAVSKAADNVVSQTAAQMTAVITGKTVVSAGEIPRLGAEFTPRMIEGEKGMAKAERSMEYVPGGLKIDVKQRPKVGIEYVGRPIYFPRSAGQEHEG